jgi:hypothetical protein
MIKRGDLESDGGIKSHTLIQKHSLTFLAYTCFICNPFIASPSRGCPWNLQGLKPRTSLLSRKRLVHHRTIYCLGGYDEPLRSGSSSPPRSFFGPNRMLASISTSINLHWPWRSPWTSAPNAHGHPWASRPHVNYVSTVGFGHLI